MTPTCAACGAPPAENGRCGSGHAWLAAREDDSTDRPRRLPIDDLIDEALATALAAPDVPAALSGLASCSMYVIDGVLSRVREG